MKARYIVKRYVDILGRLSNGKKANFDQLISVIESQDEQLSFTRRTFQRMLQDIEWIFHISIKCDKDGFYYIANNESEEEQVKLAQSFQFINYQKHFENFERHISYDTQCIVGQEYIYDIQTAIKDKNSLELIYDKFTSEKNGSKGRIIDPYGLKEYKGRWYLLGKDRDKNELRIFGLDRISRLVLSEYRFSMPRDFDIKTFFKDAIGTSVLQDEVAEFIELMFSNKLAGYIKNMPIHPSQKILTESNDGIHIRFRSYISIELVNELMMYSDDIKVIKPERLRKKLIKRAEEILLNNSFEYTK